VAKWAGGVLGLNGKIYGIPRDSVNVLEIDPVTKTIDLFTSFSGSAKLGGGVLAPNGKIYGMPQSATQILEISKINIPDVIGTDAQIPSPLSLLATSNYNKYYNKF